MYNKNDGKNCCNVCGWVLDPIYGYKATSKVCTNCWLDAIHEVQAGNMTQGKIARELGVSQQTVNEKYRRAVDGEYRERRNSYRRRNKAAKHNVTTVEESEATNE
jgi:IS30 family transposase